jgi:hypothetical protein
MPKKQPELEGLAMNRDGVESMILDYVKRIGPSTLENLAHSHPEESWNQVFAGVDHLNRDRRLTHRRRTRYE